MNFKTLLIIAALGGVEINATNTFSKDNYKLDSREWHSVKMAKKWLNNNTKSMKGKDGRIIFLFGATMPTVVCSPFKTSDIELEPGEVIKDIKAGDTIRWQFDTAISGSGDNEVSHVLVKPTDLGLSTNLTIFTDRRTYHIKIVAKRYSWTPYVTFAYSDSLSKTLASYKAYQSNKAKRYKTFNSFKNPTSGRTVDISRLNFKYSVSGSASWKPVRVYDDGIKTYIELPEATYSSELPALLVVKHGNKELVNYRYKNHTFIVDKIFTKAILITGVGSHQDKITIKRK